MCEATPKTRQFRSNLDGKATANDNFIRKPTVEFLINTFGEYQTEKFGTAEYSKKVLGITTNDLITKRPNYISMLSLPEISGSFKSKLQISSEINDLISADIYFEYALCNIFSLLEKSLSSAKKPYQISVLLDDEDIPKWKHANIIVRIVESDYDSIFKLWNDVGSEVGEYLASLKGKATIPRTIAEGLYNFINIIFTPGT